MIKPLIEGRQLVRIVEVGGSEQFIGVITDFDETLELIRLESNDKLNAQTYIIPLSSILNIRLVKEKAWGA